LPEVGRDRPRLTRRQGLLFAGVVVMLVAYPLLSHAALAHLGVRTTALLLAAVVAPTFAFAGRSVAATFGAQGTVSWAPVLLLLVAVVTGDRRCFLFVPAAVHAVLFALFRDSLRQPMSMVEVGARFLEPHAPAFIGPYCRKVTAAWAAFFLGNAVAISLLALAAPTSWWERYTGWIVYALIALMAGVEFLIRKWWFRYYFYGTPFDRVWSMLFPAENTPQGRRSMEYITQARAELRRQGKRKGPDRSESTSRYSGCR
jgi:uncharacterized membrane protein